MFSVMSLPSVDALTATNLSKLSSTRTRIASERESMELCRCAIPAAKSWYVTFGCTAERKAFGSKDLDVMRIAAPIRHHSSKLHTARGTGPVKMWTNGIPCPGLSHCQRTGTPEFLHNVNWRTHALDKCPEAQGIALSFNTPTRTRELSSKRVLVVNIVPFTVPADIQSECRHPPL